MEIHICNLPLVDDYKTVQIKTVWFDSNMTILILNENAAWKGTLLFTQLTQISETFNMSSAEHLTKCKEVLTTDQGVQDFSYHLEQNCFVWKKKILTDMKIKFGQVDIEKVPVSEARKDIMNTLLSQNKTFKSKVGSCEQEIEKLNSENSELLRTLEEFTDAKVRNERVVYGKVVALINTKKQRIACLEKLLFKNLCADAEEAKAVKTVDRINWDSDTEPEDEHMDTRLGPTAHCTMEDIDCEDTDQDTEEDEAIPSSKPSSTTYNKMKRTQNNQGYSTSRLNQTPGTSAGSTSNSARPNPTISIPNETSVNKESSEHSAKKLKLSPADKSGSSLGNGKNEAMGALKKIKSFAEMDSQEMLDLL